MYKSITVWVLLVSLAGCTSFKSTILQRTPGGGFQLNQPQSQTRGVPVKLKVPTHLEVVIQEEFFLQKTGDQNAPQFEEIFVKRHGQVVRPLNVETEVIYTDKVFTVDFRRPAGGVLNINEMKFDSEQYFGSLKATYTEQTLKDIHDALGSLKGPLGFKTAVDDPHLKSFNREVARARFDISEPGWEDQLHCFVEQHVGGGMRDEG